MKVRCPDGHKFNINLEKHQNRDYVICPKAGCYNKVKIPRGKKWKFVPNPKWPEEKQPTRRSTRSTIKMFPMLTPSNILHKQLTPMDRILIALAAAKKPKTSVNGNKTKKEKPT